MKEKVLVVASIASMIEQFNMPNIRLLLKMGYEVHVACNFEESGNIPTSKALKFKEEIQQLGCKTHQIDFKRNPFKINHTIKAYRQMKNLLKNGYSIVHSHSPIGGVLARLAARKYRKNGLFSIYTAHGFHFYTGSPKINWIIYYPLEKLLSRFTDVLITINKEDYQRAKIKMHAKETIYLRGVGLDLNKFKSRDKNFRNNVRIENGFKEEDFILIFVGELNNNKNQMILIEAIKNLNNEFNNLKLLLVGQGQNYEEYNEYIKNNNLTSNVFLLGYRDDISTLMAMSDIAVSSSLREGLPVNIMEAMSTGLPIIASNCRGNVDLVQNEVNGLVYDVEDSQDLIYKIRRLYTEKETRMSMSKNSSDMIKEYGVNHIMDKTKDIYLKSS